MRIKMKERMKKIRLMRIRMSMEMRMMKMMI